MIACAPDQKTYLIDWGNARIGPAAIDLVNCIESIDAPAWRSYWAQIAVITGTPPTGRALEIGYRAARAFINVQYLPFAIGRLGEDRALRMLRRALDAADSLD